MFRPRAKEAVRLLVLLLICIASPIPGTSANVQTQQQTEAVAGDAARGIAMYRKGDLLGAIEALRTAVKYQKEDGQAWLYLGLALNRMSHTKDARKAFEKAVKLIPDSAEARTGLAYTLLLANKVREATREAERALILDAKNAEAHYILGIARMKAQEPANALKEAEAALSLKPEFSPALLLKSQAIIGAYAEKIFFVDTSPTAPATDEVQMRYATLKEAAESLEKYLRLNPNARDADLWREQLEGLRPYAQFIEDARKPDAERTLFTAKELTTKARILAKPEPGYTEEARMNQISGRVLLGAVLAYDGTVKHILVLSDLPYGLTQKAIAAARKIKFVPAVKDGRSVSMSVLIEYNFNVY